MSLAFIYGFSDHLKDVARKGGGKLPLVPRAVPTWKIETTKGGELDYIAWPLPEYNTAMMIWVLQANQWATQGLDRTAPPWPLGNGVGVSKTLDKYIPGAFGPEKEATKVLSERVFSYVPTVGQARELLEVGMRKMDPDYPWTRRITPGWILASSLATVSLAYLIISK